MARLVPAWLGGARHGEVFSTGVRIMAVAKKTTSTNGATPSAKTNRAAAHLAAMEAGAKASEKPGQGITLPSIKITVLQVVLDGDAPLICHNWSAKAKKQILDKQMQVASQGRDAKDPERDFLESLYPMEDGSYGFPAIAFKNAAVEACTSLGKSVTKVAARQAFHIVGDLVKVEGKPTPREDMVRVGQGTADIRFRGEFKKWSVKLTIRFNARVLSAEQVVNMLNTAGFAVGVGEYRPEKNGSFGLFHVKGTN
jgi:hypothetical protein